MSHSLSPEELKFYDRQIQLAQCGYKGQVRLKSSTVAVIGAGGLGCAALTALALTGVGHLIIFDFDHVNISNLHRQSLYRHHDIGQGKVKVAQSRLLELNPWIKITIIERALRRYADLELLQEADLIVDCTDRFSARANIAALCKDLQIPHAYASVSGTDGQVALFYPQGACFRCVFKHLPTGGVIQSCDQAGVIGVSPQMIGAMQAQIAVDYLLSDRPKSIKKSSLNLITTQSFKSYEMTIQQAKTCPLCSALAETKVESKVAAEPFPIPISVEEVQKRFGKTNRSEKQWQPIILDVRTQEERILGSIEGSIHYEATSLIECLEQADLTTLKEANRESYELLTQGDILVYCARGPRAEKVARALHITRQKLRAKNELTHTLRAQNEIYELVGGYSRWSEQAK